MNSETTADENDAVVTFMQQMIPHHINAVNMAKLILKETTQEELDAVEDFEDILYTIINVQNFQIHVFRNYLNPEGNYLGGDEDGECVGSETTVCMKVNLFASETGYYELDRGDFEELSGPSPDIRVKIGDTITFDQSDITNWYHPVGFAYRQDGAHGDDWGGEENPEVEGLGELQYLIDGEAPTCEDAGDTGLDCYEPEFFYPRGDWAGKKYSAELTITQDVADASVGGVIYYFCHIHSKMSGKIIIEDYEGDDEEQDLYSPVMNDSFDTGCGTSGTSEYRSGGEEDCGVSFFGGSLDTNFEQCLQAIDCQMFSEMNSETTADENDKIVTFMQQMIPHHINAVNMAKLVLKQSTQEELAAVEEFEDVLWTIINVQNFQIHSFRNYLNPENNYLGETDDALDGEYVGASSSSDESGAVSQWNSIVLGVSAAAGFLL